MSADAFVAQATAQRPSVGTTTQLSRVAVGEIQTNPAGIIFFVATYNISQLRSDGASATSTYDVYFVLQGGVWKRWFSARR